METTMLRFLALSVTLLLVGCSDSPSETPAIWQATHLGSDGTVWAGPPRATIEEATADADAYISEKSVDEDAIVVAQVPDGAYPSMAYMMSFTPIEPDVIASKLGVEFVELDDPSQICGTWSYATHGATTKPQIVTYKEDGTVDNPGDSSEGPAVKWQCKEGVLIKTFWVPPMPEYGVNEASWESSSCRCALATDGRIILWNNDGSLIHVLTRQNE